MIPPSTRMAALLGAAISGVAVIAAPPARAHPHVWVTVETTVAYDRGTVTGLRQRWYFDEIYTSMAIQGLDANADGVYDRSELAELARVNIEGLKEFGYFTFAKLADQPLEFDTPTDVVLEHTEVTEVPGQRFGLAGTPELEETGATGGFWSKLTGYLLGPPQLPKRMVLALEFTLPLKQPVLADAEGFTFSTKDPSFFIWFDLASDNPIRLSEGAPAGCKADVIAPSQDFSQGLQLSEAALNENDGINISIGSAKTVSISCPK